MKCPYCNFDDTRVIDSRQTDEGHAIRRRRVCDNCGKRFTTYEKAELMINMVVKKDGRREAFDRNKVIGGIIRACEKRPVPMAEIEKMGERIERKINSLGKNEVSSDYVGELVMDELRTVDQVAYIRFASVYRQFADVEKFAEEIDKIRMSNKTVTQEESSPDVLRIAIDGPSGAGKSTVARAVAEKLGIDYIDTGAMYRAVGYKMLREGVGAEDTGRVERMLNDTEIDFRSGRIFLDGEDISADIRTPEISEAASECAQIGIVREKLVQIQREIGHRKSVVMDGRDIGTNVFPDAQFKFFLTATPEERARRRFEQLGGEAQELSYDEILQDVRERDYRDTHRELNPLSMAEDAIEIDSTDINEEETISAIYSRITEEH
jgi:cytidylate kinase